MEDVWNTHTVLVNKKLIEENRKRDLLNGNLGKKRINTTNKKMDEHSETFVHKKIDKKVSELIKNGRIKKNLKQKELANKLNISIKTIIGYENGSLKPDNKLLGRIEKILEIKLRGKI